MPPRANDSMSRRWFTALQQELGECNGQHVVLVPAKQKDESRPPLDQCAHYASLLRQCASAKALAEGKRVHSQLTSVGYDRDTFLGNLLVQLYGNCRSLKDARNAFENIRRKNRFSWNIMMAACIQNEHLQEARSMFDETPERDVVSWNAMITAYARIGHLRDGKNMFEKMPQQNVVSWNAIVTAYAENGVFYEATEMFNKMPERDLVSWHAMIAAYAQTRNFQDARKAFDKMSKQSVVSWNAIISAYVQDGNLEEASALFNQMPEQDTVSWNSMITAYAQCGDFQEARKIFVKMPNRDVVSWNAMISAYVQNRNLLEARRMFDEMPRKDAGSWNTMIAAYVQHGYVEEARSIYDKLTEPNTVSSTSMLTAYAQSGQVDEAKSIFDRMPQKDVISWSAMMTAYAQNGQSRETLRLYQLRDLEGVPPDRSSFIVILDACASLSALALGRVLHGYACDCGLDSDVSIGNSLLSMYGKCACLKDARKMFDKMPERNVVSWNSMITAYAQNGHIDESLELGQTMIQEGEQPDHITFINILCACSHKGLLHDGWSYFVSIEMDHGVSLTIDHYHCMIDLLARLGRLQDAEALVDSMPFQPLDIAWRTLLSACTTYGDMLRGSRAAEQVIKLGLATPGEYVMLSNLYKATTARDDGSSQAEVC